MTETDRGGLPRFVVDAHSLWWYMKSSPRLSSAAADIFAMANTGRAVLIVPAIVVAEVYYLSVKTGQPLPPADLLGVIDTSASLASSDLGRRQLEMLDRLTEIPEMHDRLIAASPQVQSIW